MCPTRLRGTFGTPIDPEFTHNPLSRSWAARDPVRRLPTRPPGHRAARPASQPAQPADCGDVLNRLREQIIPTVYGDRRPAALALVRTRLRPEEERTRAIALKPGTNHPAHAHESAATPTPGANRSRHGPACLANPPAHQHESPGTNPHQPTNAKARRRTPINPPMRKPGDEPPSAPRTRRTGLGRRARMGRARKARTDGPWKRDGPRTRVQDPFAEVLLCIRRRRVLSEHSAPTACSQHPQSA